jgi:hypothetical protein
MSLPDRAGRASTGGLLGTAVAPTAEVDAVEPFGAYERAALDLAVGIDQLGRAIDGFIYQQLRAHLGLVAAAQAVCAAEGGATELLAAIARLRAALAEAAP